MDNDDAIMAGEDDLVRAEDTDREPQAEPDNFELELDGEVHTLPAALKGAFLRQADYTRKTQELAEHRRALEGERQAVQAAAQAHAGASQDTIRLAALDHRLEEFRDVDWDAFVRDDPHAAQLAWDAAQRLSQARTQLAYAVAHHSSRAELDRARQAAEAMAETGRQLSQDIEGWSPEIASKLVQYAQAFGVTIEELGQAADPRLWKLLHRAWRADHAEQQEAQVQAQAVRPAVLVSSGGGGGAGVRDELATKEWMRRRNEQMMRGR
jgi:hypothetical protein